MRIWIRKNKDPLNHITRALFSKHDTYDYNMFRIEPNPMYPDKKQLTFITRTDWIVICPTFPTIVSDQQVRPVKMRELVNISLTGYLFLQNYIPTPPYNPQSAMFVTTFAAAYSMINDALKVPLPKGVVPYIIRPDVVSSIEIDKKTGFITTIYFRPELNVYYNQNVEKVPLIIQHLPNIVYPADSIQTPIFFPIYSGAFDLFMFFAYVCDGVLADTLDILPNKIPDFPIPPDDDVYDDDFELLSLPKKMKLV